MNRVVGLPGGQVETQLRFNCRICRHFSSNCKSNFNRHNLELHSDHKETINYGVRKLRFRTKWEAIVHSGWKPNAISHICTQCPNHSYKKAVQLQTHLNRAHGIGKRAFNCQFCPFKSLYKHSYNRHMTGQHNIGARNLPRLVVAIQQNERENGNESNSDGDIDVVGMEVEGGGPIQQQGIEVDGRGPIQQQGITVDGRGPIQQQGMAVDGRGPIQQQRMAVDGRGPIQQQRMAVDERGPIQQQGMAVDGRGPIQQPIIMQAVAHPDARQGGEQALDLSTGPMDLSLKSRKSTI